MKMRVLIVDNRSDDPAVVNMRGWIESHFPGSYCQTIDSRTFEPGELLAHKPDVVLVDVALDPDEEMYFDKLTTTQAAFDAERKLSGIEYCRRLKASFGNLPVILMSLYFDPRILTVAIEAGADGFIWKRQLEKEHFIPAVEATFVRHKTDDIAFYARLRGLLEDEAAGAWNREHMLYAMDAFFTHGSGTRRLTGLWCTLAEIVEEVLPSETVNELLRALMDTEALLLAANPRMRDHVRHAGNVFWLGYYLLNSVEALKNLEGLAGFSGATFAGSSRTPFEQTNLAWLLSALLHDVGYLGERLGKVEERLERGRSLFALESGKKAKGVPVSSARGVSELQAYLPTLGDKGSRLYTAIDHTSGLLGKPHPQDDAKTVSDHGIASARAFLSRLNREGRKDKQCPEVLHAASAIALHNLAKWNVEWPEPGGGVELPVYLLPAAWLLGYCDELQGWGRGPECDPFNVEMAAKVSEARRRYREGYILGSRISSFEVRNAEDVTLKTGVNLDIQYMMVQGENADAVAGDVRAGILKWRRERVESLRRTLGLDGLLQTTIRHIIPGPVGDDIVIRLDASEECQA